MRTLTSPQNACAYQTVKKRFQESKMKILLIVAAALLGQVVFSAKQKEGGNCEILAGTYEGFYSWKDMDGMCISLW